MKKLYAVTSIHSIGCTFVDWSIHWLSGQTQFYNCDLGWQPISTNPLTDTNAHSHPKNHPWGYDNTVQCVQQLNDQTGLLSLYPWPKPVANAAQDLGIDIDQQLSSKSYQSICQLQQTEYSAALQATVDQGAQLIYVDLPNDVSFYLFGSSRSRERTIKKPYKENLYASSEVAQDFDNLFFADSQKQWQSLNLTHVWDQRERMALNWDLSQQSPILFDYNVPHFYVDVRTLWSHTEHTILSLLHCLALDIDQSRLEHWQHIAQQWKKSQYSRIWFAFNCEHIVQAIVNGWSMTIDLDFYQEAAVQHCLIYQHGLNLKTWKLEKFPNNTKALHSLLEPNIHPL